MKLFWGKQKEVEDILRRYCHEYGQCLDLFVSGIDDYFDNGDRDQLGENVQRTHTAESLADDLLTELGAVLYGSALFPESRGDILGLVEALDSVVNKAEATLRMPYHQYIIVPQELATTFKELVSTVRDCTKVLRKSAEMLFDKFHRAASYYGKVDQLESQTDAQEAALIEKIFTSDLETGHKILLRDLASSIADFVVDGVVNYKEFAVMASNWQTCDRYVVRLGFEEFAVVNEVQIVEQYSPQGIHFQDLGDGNGSISFETSAITPFGNINWPEFPPIGLISVGIPLDNSPNANIRYITFDQPASTVSFLYTQGLITPQFAWPIVTAWDGPDGTGNVLNDNPDQIKSLPGEQLPDNLGQTDLWEFYAGSFIIKSITIVATPNTIGINEIIIDSATTPMGGYLNISSILDSTTPPEVFLNGNPSYLGEFKGASPNYLISITEGVHTITLYSPGYEWVQQTTTIIDGHETILTTTLIPATEPNYVSSISLLSNGLPLDAGDRASPSLADWDSDGDNDLIIGNSIGELLCYENINNNTTPQYTTGVTLLSGAGTNASPVVIDFYTDEKNDLVVGFSDGTVKLFYNQGTRTDPNFSGSPYDTTLVTLPTTEAVPFLVDWDNNHKKDLLVGGVDGNVYLYLNQRLDASPDYSTTPTIVATVSSNASPCAILDYDGDGKKDLLVGEGDGTINLFLNQNTDEAPVLTTSTKLQTADNQTIDVGSDARPLILYYDSDVRKDLLVGAGDGTIRLYLSQ